MRVFPLHMHRLQREGELRSNVPIFPFASVCQSTLSSTDFLPPHSGARYRIAKVGHSLHL